MYTWWIIKSNEVENLNHKLGNTLIINVVKCPNLDNIVNCGATNLEPKKNQIKWNI